MAALLGILGFLGALAPFLTAVLGWIQRQSDKQAGVALEAGAVARQTAATQVNIAQAAANAPNSQAAVVGALNAGTF